MATLIVVEDFVAPSVKALGGHAMFVIQALHGLRRLGHEVFFFEYLCEPPDPASLDYFDRVMGRWWFPERTALIAEPDCASHYGLAPEQIRRVAGQASALLTFAAHYRSTPWPLTEDVHPRVMVDGDPGYTHLWAQSDGIAAIYGDFDLYFTVGCNVGTPRSKLPTLGIEWGHMMQPVVLDWWPAERPVERDRFTTIARWRDYGYLDFDGRVLGPKAEEFRKFIRLPELAGEPLELALEIGGDDPDLAQLESHGWLIEQSRAVATPDAYRDYVAGSLGEFSCAKGGYVGTSSGWFSDRSACYLASGRPVVLQATGYEALLPVGEGLFAPRTAAEAAESIREIRVDYSRHSRAARSIAREFFDSDKVLHRLLSEAGVR